MARRRRFHTTEWVREAEELAEQYNTARFQFITTEVDLGITFCKIAAWSSDPEKIERNTLNAEQAAKAAKHFLDEGRLNRAMDEAARMKIERLESHLRGLRKRSSALA